MTHLKLLFLVVLLAVTQLSNHVILGTKRLLARYIGWWKVAPHRAAVRHAMLGCVVYLAQNFGQQIWHWAHKPATKPAPVVSVPPLIQSPRGDRMMYVVFQSPGGAVVSAHLVPAAEVTEVDDAYGRGVAIKHPQLVWYGRYSLLLVP